MRPLRPSNSQKITPRNVPSDFPKRFEEKESDSKEVDRKRSAASYMQLQQPHELAGLSSVEVTESSMQSPKQLSPGQTDRDKSIEVIDHDIVVYGDWFDPDTRTVKAMLQIAGVT